MTKKIIFLLIFNILLMFSLTSCANKPDLPRVSAQLKTDLKEDNSHFLEWTIQNLEDERTLTFEDGNIMQYTVKHIKTHKTYSNIESNNKSTIILNPGEIYTEKIPLDIFLKKGEYKAVFWAISKEGTSPKFIITFRKH